MRFLQSNIPMFHRVSPPGTICCNNWKSHVPLDSSSELHLHHEMISCPPRNLQDCSGMPSLSTAPTLLHLSSSVSTFLQQCCSDRDGTTADRFNSQYGPFKTPSASPSSPCMIHPQKQGVSSLLSISSGFSSFPVIIQGPQGVYNTSSPIKDCSSPTCSTATCGHSHPTSNFLTNSKSLTNPQTPVHPPSKPTGQPQYHTAFSPLTPSGVHTSVPTEHNNTQRSTARQNDPVGSSPVHHTQDNACSLLRHLSNRVWRFILLWKDR